MNPTYIYGVIRSDAAVPEDLVGLGPSGEVEMISHGDLTALVSDVPMDRPLGTRDDLFAHERVVDTVAASATVLPMRFPAVVERHAVVDELLAPHHDHLAAVLDDLDDRVQYTLKGRYEQDVVLREVLADDPEIRELQERVRELPEDASYYDRVRLGELIVEELQARRDEEGAVLVERLAPEAAAVVANTLAAPDDVVNAAFLVERSHQQRFEDSVEKLGAELAGRIRLRLLGPLAPYDFVPEE
ncbi:GvpL/GvpF family gas vesicle protein [Pseudonocardia bannensis]|uniref:GvpL/GvpF family gas vesicle protein n=1 Tax=Pseudonocardia bannensis TaxID=630973 RepID=A0A848DTW7_9PSEU|nr:GvpL/GvpF family gas vesicle protein [Pseudonocardia bannensis]NMH95644.1 GvpL/GvpF family gas vesicle protein [Pseudonocardia bannensis]